MKSTSTEPPIRNILIRGGSCVGIGLMGLLCRAKLYPDFLGHEEVADALRYDGLYLSGIHGEHVERVYMAAYSDPAEVPNKQFDFAILATKCTGLEGAARSLASVPGLIAPQTKIVAIQNGWGIHDLLAKYFPRNRIFSGCLSTGFKKPDPSKPNWVHITAHNGPAEIGSLFREAHEQLQPLADALTLGGLETRAVPDVDRSVWGKIQFNNPVNALAAIHHCSIGHLAQDPTILRQMHTIVVEAWTVMEREGYQTRHATLDEYLEAFDRMLHRTAPHVPSMVDDEVAGRPTEIEFLTGQIVRMAERFGLSVPENLAIYNEIKRREGRSARRGTDCLK